MRLLNRTNRSVTLTAAGQELYATISNPYEAIIHAVEDLNRFRDAPTGRIRLNVMEDAASLLLRPALPVFVDRYPDIELDLAVSNRMIDVIAEEVRCRHTLWRHRPGRQWPSPSVSPGISVGRRGSPAYLGRFGTPRHPNDLLQHRCLKIRLGDDRIYRWEFERAGEALALAVPGAITIDETQVGRALALEGAALMYVPEPSVARDIDIGTLRVVLGYVCHLWEPAFISSTSPVPPSVADRIASADRPHTRYAP